MKLSEELLEKIFEDCKAQPDFPRPGACAGCTLGMKWLHDKCYENRMRQVEYIVAYTQRTYGDDVEIIPGKRMERFKARFAG